MPLRAWPSACDVPFAGRLMSRIETGVRDAGKRFTVCGPRPRDNRQSATPTPPASAAPARHIVHHALIATGRLPQTREKRRADPAEVIAAYRATVERLQKLNEKIRREHTSAGASSNRARSRPCAGRSRRSARHAPNRSGSPARRPSGDGAAHDVMAARLQPLNGRRRHAALDHGRSRLRRTCAA